MSPNNKKFIALVTIFSYTCRNLLPGGRGVKRSIPAEYEMAILPEEDGYFAVRFPDFPGIITGGPTPEEAVRNAREALQVTLEAMRDRKIPLPTPKRMFSGQFNIRVPRSLHRALVRSADEEGVSLNALVSHLLHAGIAQSGK
ncbi:MAG: type II toxin-antitoxin system HicB family antitoxin [Actinomycetia bacterium]|nr:type II toxin-antitoxin system HicB family antitoxin [Actinomycetes bacterium]